MHICHFVFDFYCVRVILSCIGFDVFELSSIDAQA